MGSEALQERLESAISVLSNYISEEARTLKLEHSKYPLRFDLRKLTVVADTPDGPVPMERMGSGENWVGYHVAVHLAMHRFFVERGRPLPRFLVVDQPSQTQFPAERDLEGKLAGRDEDRAAVVRLFKSLLETVKNLHPKFQIILTEHADPDESWYQEAVVERWRGGQALIPSEWLSKEGAGE